MAKRSILVAGIFGLLSSLMVVYTGDSSSKTLARVQPVKFAAMEAHYEGKSNAGLVAIGILKESESKIIDENIKDFVFKIEIPSLLSILTGGSKDVYVPGIKELILGNEELELLPVSEKIRRGEFARQVLVDFKDARQQNDIIKRDSIAALFKDEDFQENYFRYFGYSSINKPEDVIPNVSISFYSFHLMVMLGFLFILLFAMSLYFLFKGTLTDNRWFLWILFFSLPLPYIAGELGWVLAEVGRQPWIIQDLMSVSGAVSQISSGSVITTFILFAVLFTVLLISEISIMVRQIKTGPKH
jgi:cytochrome d ubiquinol oxidase subunit I